MPYPLTCSVYIARGDRHTNGNGVYLLCIFNTCEYFHTFLRNIFQTYGLKYEMLNLEITPDLIAQIDQSVPICTSTLSGREPSLPFTYYWMAACCPRPLTSTQAVSLCPDCATAPCNQRREQQGVGIFARYGEKML